MSVRESRQPRCSHRDVQTRNQTCIIESNPVSDSPMSQSDQIRCQFLGINLLPLCYLPISSLNYGAAQPAITEPHRPLLNVYIVTLLPERLVLTQELKKEQMLSHTADSSYEGTQAQTGREADHDPKWPQLVWAEDYSQIQHACVLFHGVPSHPHSTP